jgi:hypothetical protein
MSRKAYIEAELSDWFERLEALGFEKSEDLLDGNYAAGVGGQSKPFQIKPKETRPTKGSTTPHIAGDRLIDHLMKGIGEHSPELYDAAITWFKAKPLLDELEERLSQLFTVLERRL